MTVDEQLAYLTKGCVDVVRAAELRLKLERSLRRRASRSWSRSASIRPRRICISATRCSSAR